MEERQISLDDVFITLQRPDQEGLRADPGHLCVRRLLPGGAGSGPLWLLIEEQQDGKIKYAFSNLPEGTSLRQAVRLWKSRWPVEQGYQQMKEELGLDHFEGRSWAGFHHHAAMVMLAYGFLLLERHRGQEHPVKPGEKGGRQPALTLPAVRRALQQLLRPVAKPDCQHCRAHLNRPLCA